MPSFSLERFVGAAAGDDAAFDGRETYTVGRKPSCNLVLSDSRVSGLHATFSKQEAGRIAVVDSSSNGTPNIGWNRTGMTRFTDHRSSFFEVFLATKGRHVLGS